MKQKNKQQKTTKWKKEQITNKTNAAWKKGTNKEHNNTKWENNK